MDFAFSGGPDTTINSVQIQISLKIADSGVFQQFQQFQP